MNSKLYLECYSGISGDMMVAALLDLGADQEVLKKALQSLPLEGFQIKISRVKKSGLDACDFAVLLDAAHENHDHDMSYLHGANANVHAHPDQYAYAHVHDGSGEHVLEPPHEHEQSDEHTCEYHHADSDEHTCEHHHADSAEPTREHHHADSAEPAREHRHADSAEPTREHHHADSAEPTREHHHTDSAEPIHDHPHELALEHTDARIHGQSHEHFHSHTHEHRGLREVLEIIQRSAISENAKELAGRIFQILAKAEAKAHGVEINQVHFHEVGAVDSIVDIVAAAVCIDNLGIKEVIVPVLYEGTGVVRCQHGIIPIPVPAVANILADNKLQLHITGTEGEFVTPTGAAIAAAIQTSHQLPNQFLIEKIGIGAGKRNYERASILRAIMIQNNK